MRTGALEVAPSQKRKFRGGNWCVWYWYVLACGLGAGGAELCGWLCGGAVLGLFLTTKIDVITLIFVNDNRNDY